MGYEAYCNHRRNRHPEENNVNRPPTPEEVDKQVALLHQAHLEAKEKSLRVYQKYNRFPIMDKLFRRDDDIQIVPKPTFEEWLQTSEYANTPRAKKLLKRIQSQPKPKNYKVAY